MDNKRDIIKSLLGKIQMKDMGEKIKKAKEAVATSADMPSVRYPTLYLNAKQMPDLKGYEVDDKCDLVIQGRILSHTLNESDNNRRENFEIEIKKMAIIK